VIAEPIEMPVDDLRTFLAALWQPGDVREVRIPKNGRRPTAAGWFDDPALLAGAVAGWDGKANLYLTLNPVNPALLARAVNRIDPGAIATTSDADIVERRLLLVDVDPKRPAGISATDDENEAARDVARAVHGYLTGLGWPAPLVEMTGNGYALLYAVALPNNPASTALVSGVLGHLAGRFDDARVTIDVSVSNAARIGCLVGTLKVKGDATADRPHRRSGIVRMPEQLDVVPVERLVALVPATTGNGSGPAPAGVAPGWVREWLDRAGVGYREKERGGATWFRLDDCPFHSGEDAGGDCGVGEAGDGRGMGHCFHNRGAGKGWQDFRAALGLGPPPGFTFTGTASSDGSPLPEPAEPEADAWPEAPTEAAYHGVLGDIARAVAPYTEADPIGILGTLAAMFGAACGGARTLYQGSLQRTNLSVLLVGETGMRGRKGTGLDIGRAVFRLAYPPLADLWLVGVASGEAITGHLGRHDGCEGRPDEDRVLIVEPEFGRLLTIMNRDGSTLSPVLRNAWDGVPLGHARARDESLVTRHHVAMLGHVTPVELRAKLTDVDAANGFANRLLFLAVRRQRLIPFPTAPDEIVRPWLEPLHLAIVEARLPGEMSFDAAARDRWEDFYAELALTPRLGLSGAVTGRHEAQVARLSLVYALADRSPVVGVAHLEAAIALAEYARRSATWALGDSTGNRHADVLRRMLADGEISWLDARRALGLRTAADMAEVVAVLTAADMAEVVAIAPTGGGRSRRIIRAKCANYAKCAGGARAKERGIAT
jgi:hypothetical protein